jgi:hypothetical protein
VQLVLSTFALDMFVRCRSLRVADIGMFGVADSASPSLKSHKKHVDIGIFNFT